MPAIREHDIPPCDLADDGAPFPRPDPFFKRNLSSSSSSDGMPPLVDNPNPSMTFTFFTDMTPITALSADPTIPFETVWENPVPTSASLTELIEPLEPINFTTLQTPAADRVGYNKKRDASYIPRPPNAFILFRSSFIRSQQVPEKVEGNHSTLSKIIGKYWKTLPREEREVWEAKALVAQAEHRKRYPDWRFRPGANALAKIKVKDGPQYPNNRKRTSQAGRKVKGDPADKKAKSGDERCTIIADLLMEGKTGMDLEDAVRQWEDSADRGSIRKDRTRTRKRDRNEHGGITLVSEVETIVSSARAEGFSPTNDPESTQADGRNSCTSESPQTRALTPDTSRDDRFRIPLTGMFKRSLSAPAGQSTPNHPSSNHRQSSLDGVFANVSYDISESQRAPSLGAEQTEELANAVSADTIGCLSPLVLPSILREGVPARWNDPYNLLETSLGLPPSTADCPGLTYALHTPASSVSSVEEQPFARYDFCAAANTADFDKELPPAYIREGHNTYHCTPKSWAECGVVHQHTQMMPIFVNQYAGTENVYDWCAPSYTTYPAGSEDTTHDVPFHYHYPGNEDDQYGNYMRIQTADCLPAVAY